MNTIQQSQFNPKITVLFFLYWNCTKLVYFLCKALSDYFHYELYRSTELYWNVFTELSNIRNIIIHILSLASTSLIIRSWKLVPVFHRFCCVKADVPQDKRVSCCSASIFKSRAVPSFVITSLPAYSLHICFVQNNGCLYLLSNCSRYIQAMFTLPAQIRFLAHQDCLIHRYFDSLSSQNHTKCIFVLPKSQSEWSDRSNRISNALLLWHLQHDSNDDCVYQSDRSDKGFLH